MTEHPALYDVARQVCHAHGIPWTDPRTGVTYPPPETTPRDERESPVAADSESGPQPATGADRNSDV